MRSHDLTLGRTFGVTFDHGEDFFTALAEFCRVNNVRHGYIPSFIAGFAEVDIVGTCDTERSRHQPGTRRHQTGITVGTIIGRLR